MEWEDTASLTVFEKKGLHQEAGILENYGIDCETEVSLLDKTIFPSWHRMDSIPWKERSSNTGVTLCVYVPRAC